MTHSLAIDIGGTFTDVVLRADNGALSVEKVLTTHDDLLRGFFGGVSRALDKAGVEAGEVEGLVVHATTIVTNALIERKGVTTALITTRGFADVLSIRNEHRYEMYDPQIEFAPPLIPRRLTFELDERTLADGTIERGVNTAEAAALIEALKASEVESVAVCLLNSFRNPANERAMGALLEARAGDIHVSLSHRVAPQIREYPRASTTAVNAYAMPITEPYLTGMAKGLHEAGIPNRALIMLSSGGIIGAEIAARNPVRMIESGPAAGALAAAWYAERLGLDRLLSFDMGGTTAKACLIEDHKPLVASTFEVDRMYRFCEGSGMPLTLPSIDMIEIGAGGGSIAAVDDLGLLKVGPRSAGSMPGPACYGQGGEEPTVTDADLLLGLLDPGHFLGGDMSLDLAAARAALTRLGDGLGVDPERAAAGVYRIVAETMAAAARAHAADRGIDHRGVALLAFGGAGPVHACAVGALLESEGVIFPPQASVLSAFGALVTPVRLDLVRSALGMLSDLNWDEVDALLGDMEREGLTALEQAGCEPEGVRLKFAADLRYFGQQNELTVDLDHDPREIRDVQVIAAAFAAAYRAQYGVNPSHVPVEIVSWRLSALGPQIAGAGPPAAAASPGGPRTSRPVALWPEAGDVPIYDRGDLAVGQTLAGPAIIEERETTIVLPPRWTARVNELACVVARRDETAGRET